MVAGFSSSVLDVYVLREIILTPHPSRSPAVSPQNGMVSLSIQMGGVKDVDHANFVALAPALSSKDDSVYMFCIFYVGYLNRY